MIEFREAAYDKIMELLDESFTHNKKTKLALCELESAICDVFEKEHEEEEEHYEDHEDYSEEPEESEMSYRRRSRVGMRSASRAFGRRRMHMRRDRLGRYAY